MGASDRRVAASDRRMMQGHGPCRGDTMADIVLNEVSKSFGAVSVLDKVSMHIKSGEFIVFLGPSGCGKSTLLRMIAGLEQVSEGEIFIGDRRVDQLPPNE